MNRHIPTTEKRLAELEEMEPPKPEIKPPEPAPEPPPAEPKPVTEPQTIEAKPKAPEKVKKPWEMTREEFLPKKRIPSIDLLVEEGNKKQMAINKRYHDIAVIIAKEKGVTDKEKLRLAQSVFPEETERRAIKDNEYQRLRKERNTYEKFAEEHYAINEKYNQKSLEHRKAVQQALSENKPVPPEVLAEYPELKAKPKDVFDKAEKPDTAKKPEPVGGVVAGEETKTEYDRERLRLGYHDLLEVDPSSPEFKKLNDLYSKQGEEVLARYRETYPDMPVVLTQERTDDYLTGVIIHKSVKKPGRWQVTTWDRRGFSGDTNKATEEKAVQEAFMDGYRTPNPELFDKVSTSKEFLEGVERNEIFQKEHRARMAQPPSEVAGSEKEPPKPEGAEPIDWRTEPEQLIREYEDLSLSNIEVQKKYGLKSVVELEHAYDDAYRIVVDKKSAED